MSAQAKDWARRMREIRSATKFVLLSLAEYANHHDEVWASCAQIMDDTNMDRKSVLVNIALLVKFGLMIDTGKRVGRTGSVIVYRMNLSTSCPISGTVELSQKRDSFESETVPKAGQLQNGSSPKFPAKQSQISSEAVPNLGHGTHRNPKEPSSALNACEARLPEPTVDNSEADPGSVREADELELEWQALTGKPATSIDEAFLGQMADEGVRVEHLRLAWATARTRKPAPERIPVAYIAPILRDAVAGKLALQRAMTPEAAANDRAWLHDQGALVAKAQALGLQARPGETDQGLRKRVAEKLAGGVTQ